jgi:predicted dehydrogenase
MHLLILGYSSISERRVIPAAGRVSAIKGISIASRSRTEPVTWPKRIKFFSDYADALAASDAEIVYLSLPNAFHEQWVLAALAANKHVIVDKPAFLSADASARAIADARRRKLFLAEASVFADHPHFDALLKFVGEYGPLTHVHAQFIIPPLPKQNFRNHVALGGGCLLDMGPYAAALVRLLGGGTTEEIFALPGGQHPETGVDTGFSVLARFTNGAIFSGQFSFEGEYQNRLIVVARFGSVLIDRIFSPPADYSIVWQQRIKNAESTLTFDPVDTFARFFEIATRAIACDEFENHYRDLLMDAEFRTRLAQDIAAAAIHSAR